MLNLLGKLNLAAIPFDEPPAMIAGLGMIGGAIAVLLLITYLRKWKWLWTEWLTSVDHKRIGIMYVIVAVVMLLRGFADALLMRTQQALAVGANYGYLPPSHYDQIFTAHGVIMIFFVAMPLVIGLMNLVVPLQIGARDVAFPYLNSLSFWLFIVGVFLAMISLIVGEFAQTGWLAYPPLSEMQYSPGVGVDYYLWALQISGIGTLISGINFFCDNHKNALSWNDLNADAGIYLDFIMCQYFNYYFFSNFNGMFSLAFARSVFGFPFLY